VRLRDPRILGRFWSGAAVRESPTTVSLTQARAAGPVNPRYTDQDGEFLDGRQEPPPQSPGRQDGDRLVHPHPA
jgi:hypothetical protein